jgi:hypothetical protein
MSHLRGLYRTAKRCPRRRRDLRRRRGLLSPLVAVAAVVCEGCQEAYAEARRTIEQAGGIAKCMEVVTT